MRFCRFPVPGAAGTRCQEGRKSAVQGQYAFLPVFFGLKSSASERQYHGFKAVARGFWTALSWPFGFALALILVSNRQSGFYYRLGNPDAIHPQGFDIWLYCVACAPRLRAGLARLVLFCCASFHE